MGHQSFFETEKSPQTRMNTKKNVPDSKIRHIIWWERMDSNHRSRRQQIYSLPPLATREHSHIKIWNCMELVDGLEPPTCWLQISCSTNWATPANKSACWLGRQDSNLRHLGPKPSTLPNWATPHWLTRFNVCVIKQLNHYNLNRKKSQAVFLNNIKNIFTVNNSSHFPQSFPQDFHPNKTDNYAD